MDTRWIWIDRQFIWQGSLYFLVMYITNTSIGSWVFGLHSRYSHEGISVYSMVVGIIDLCVGVLYTIFYCTVFIHSIFISLGSQHNQNELVYFIL